MNQTVSVMIAALKELDEIFDPMINHVALFVGRIEAAGQDASNYFDVEENEFVNYIAILKQYQDAKAQAVAKVMAEYDRLNESINPEEQENSETFWKAVLIITEQVLKDGIRIKIGDFKWDSKKPLHGIGSVFYEIKDEVMKIMGVDPNSELGKIINNPVKSIADLPENAKREVENAAQNVTREAGRVLEESSSAAGKVVANSKRELDKLATDIARKIGKLIPKKIKKPRIKITW